MAGIATAIASSYIIGTRFVAPYVIKLIEIRYNNEEWLESTMEKSYKMLSKNMLASMQGSALRDVRTLNDALNEVEEGTEQAFANIPLTPETLQQVQALARKPALARKLGEYMDLYMEYGPLLQQLQPGNGGGMGGPPSIRPPNNGTW